MADSVSEKMQIRTVLVYEFRKGTTAAETFRSICQVFGEGVISKRLCEQWFQKFSSGDYSLNDQPRSGRPSVVDTDRLKATVEANRRATCADLAEEFAVSVSTIDHALHELGFKYRLNKWVPNNR